MKSHKSIILAATAFVITSSLAVAAIKSVSPVKPFVSIFSEIKDYNYVCMHITKPEALVFKTTAPQRIWKTTVNREGDIKKGKAFQLAASTINSDSIEKEGQVATFKAELAKDYEIKGFFAKDTDGDLPLTVISTYIPDGTTSQIKDQYNCEAQSTKGKLQLGSVNKE